MKLCWIITPARMGDIRICIDVYNCILTYYDALFLTLPVKTLLIIATY